MSVTKIALISCIFFAICASQAVAQNGGLTETGGTEITISSSGSYDGGYGWTQYGSTGAMHPGMVDRIGQPYQPIPSTYSQPSQSQPASSQVSSPQTASSQVDPVTQATGEIAIGASELLQDLKSKAATVGHPGGMSQEEFQTYLLSVQFKLSVAKTTIDSLESAIASYSKPKENAS